MNEDDSLPCTQVARDLTVNQGAGGSIPPAAANIQLSSEDSCRPRVVAETARSCQCIRFAECIEGAPEQVIVCAACALTGKLATFE